MLFDFVFSKKELRKSQFFQWLIDTMLDSGWENLSAHKTGVDYWSMFSTGESGDEKIGVHLRDFYLPNSNSKPDSYRFGATTYAYISARAFHTYTENPSASKVGTHTPNQAFTDIRLTVPTSTVDDKFNVYYHVNKDRAIVILENEDVSDVLSTCFFVIGKPHTIADYDEYCTSAVITSHGSKSCRSGVAQYSSESLHFDSEFRVFMPSNKNSYNHFASDIVVNNTYDGEKYIVENIFALNYGTKTLTQDMRKNTFKDSEGRIYKQLVNNNVNNLLNSSLRSLMIRIG